MHKPFCAPDARVARISAVCRGRQDRSQRTHRQDRPRGLPVRTSGRRCGCDKAAARSPHHHLTAPMPSARWNSRPIAIDDRRIRRRFRRTGTAAPVRRFPAPPRQRYRQSPAAEGSAQARPLPSECRAADSPIRSARWGKASRPDPSHARSPVELLFDPVKIKHIATLDPDPEPFGPQL